MDKDIAIIGMSGCFPQSSDLETFWDNLVQGKDMISEIPRDRPELRSGLLVNKPGNKGGFLEDIKAFDPEFFGMSNREASVMDPQQRIMLEEGWKVFEDAGYCPDEFSGTKTGVFIGITNLDYHQLILKNNLADVPYSATGNAFSIIPNRISYFLNLHGPSIAIDTACSASLVALHAAVASIRAGECIAALAGGVNLCITPEKYMELQSLGMLSGDGLCKPFDHKADGYVRSESAVMLLLKSLSYAEADKDNIRGIIKGTAVNHNGYGGFDTSITALNAGLQSELLVAAYEDAGITPDTVTYIETHGSATVMGDAIEIFGLQKAFKTLYEKYKIPGFETAHCGIGTLKANMGHSEAAAGIAGVVKVLLSMKHKTIPARLNVTKLNPTVRLKNSPFYMINEKTEWKKIKNKNGEAIPRRAGVSCFGFGGVNAHVVIEEYSRNRTNGQKVALPKVPFVFVISAKKEERLKAYANKLKKFLNAQLPTADSYLADVAYTLQIGRQAMAYRLAIIAETGEELVSKIHAYCHAENDLEGIYTGKVDADASYTSILTQDESEKSLLETLIAEKKLSQIAKFWVVGLNIDWRLLYGRNLPTRITLPTYPFEKTPYWIEASGPKDYQTETGVNTSKLHPLIHANTSSFKDQRFSTAFNGDEFFLADHVIQGKKVLPGAAYLEMIRAAIHLSGIKEAGIELTGVSKEPGAGLLFKNVVWIRPLAMGDKPMHVHISLFPKENGEILYEVCLQTDQTNDRPTVHSQGAVSVHRIAEIPVLDILELKAKCDQKQFSAKACYDAFAEIDFKYGPCHQAIETIYVGEGRALAKLTLPKSVSDTADKFGLHPSLTDGVLQAAYFVIGDMTNESCKLDPALPFALQGVEIFKNCTVSIWAYVRYAKESSPESRVKKLDIDVCDEDGIVCFQIHGFTLKLEGAAEIIEDAAQVTQKPHATQPSVETEQTESSEYLKDRMAGYLKGLIADKLQQDRHSMNTAVGLSKYGLDSIMVLNINKELERHFSDLSKTLFFEYSTINELAEYFVNSHRQTLTKLFAPDETKYGEGSMLQETVFPALTRVQADRTKYLSREYKDSVPPDDKDRMMEILAAQMKNHMLYLDDIIQLAYPDIKHHRKVNLK